jgi:hypothetical protein
MTTVIVRAYRVKMALDDARGSKVARGGVGGGVRVFGSVATHEEDVVEKICCVVV